MRLDILFLSTLNDLRARIERKPTDVDYEYNLLKTAALLRFLLIDGSCLSHLVNEFYRDKLTFVVAAIPQPAVGITYWQAGELLHPGSCTEIFGVPEQMHHLKLDKFLKLPVVSIGTQVMTVLDTIKFFANAEGGVHREETLVEQAHLQCVRDLEEKGARIDGCQPGLNMIATIARIVLDGLAPLEQKVQADWDSIWEAIEKEQDGLAVVINTQMRQRPPRG